jgi:hypothetical protein
MAVDPKSELRALIDHLDGDDAAETLTYARRLLQAHQRRVPQRPLEPGQHSVPTLHRASPVANVDDLRVDLLGDGADGEEFARAVRRWREQAEDA